MGPIGVPEMLFILAIALLIFGPKRLPEFGRTIGKALGEFRRATSDLKRSIDVEIAAAEPTAPRPVAPAPKTAAAPAAGQPVARASTPGDGEGPGAATPTAEPAKASVAEEPERPSG